jgi:hypothetical protein
MTKGLRIAYFMMGVALIIALALLTYNFHQTNVDQHKINTQQLAINKIVQDQTANRIGNVALWCTSINSIITYERKYTTGSLKQSEANATVIEKALEGKTSLTAPEVNFVRLYVGSVLNLEKSAPQILNLSPYTLKDLNCKSIEAETYKSVQPPKNTPIPDPKKS